MPGWRVLDSQVNEPTAVIMVKKVSAALYYEIVEDREKLTLREKYSDNNIQRKLVV